LAITRETVMLALTRLDELALDSLQIIDAEALADQRYPHFDPAAPVLVLGLANVDQVTKIATALLLAYPASQPCALLDDTGRHGLTLGELSQVGLAAGACLWIGPLASPGEYAALQDVAARLRAPDGCPWDRELTWAKMRASVLEEAHELLDALDAGDPAKMAEELGDLLLQVALLTQIATEEGHFRFPEVVAHIVAKLIRRHPHVFGDTQVSGTDEVLANWEAIKRAERAADSGAADSGAANGDAAQKRSPLAGIPKGLPALAQAEAYLDRMSRLREVVAPDAPWTALTDLPAEAAPTPEIVGEALFNLVSWSRARGVEAESALRETNARYAARVAAEEWG
jgi:tetrapyrrole methylase family protein/MazG family protein